ncbi:Ger(x)C family spore germination protein [Bacillus toyonensis]|uniref:Ger(x)C family spore germination protein n=1 Tax=Bacillus toyonensis TaxID=155322 RepID=UPI000BFB9819|nr:Ger(x)C family spore germination protein [Bacillus toyonensis]PHG57631.1 hypothetical protein COI59_29480 [Bacillus toyonensis]
MKNFLLFLTICCAFLVTGCWDQRLLKENSLILGAGVDLTTDNKIEDTLLYPVSIRGRDIQQKTKVISAKGDTIHNAREHADQKIAERLDASKNRFVLFGKDLAKQGIYSLLDIVYRDAKGPSNAKLAIVNGRAKSALYLHPVDTDLTSEYYPKLLDSAEKVGLIQNYTIQAICSIIFAEGKDFMIPYITVDKQENRASITGLAMFHRDKLVGTLNVMESKIFLLLMNPKQHTRFNLKVHTDEKKREQQFIDIQAVQTASTIRIQHEGENVSARITLNIKCNVTEYGKGRLTNKKKIQNLNNSIKKQLQKAANQTLFKMKQVNCDGLGIGQRIQAYHNDMWKQINWDKVYPQLPIKVDVNTEIVNTGVIK